MTLIMAMLPVVKQSNDADYYTGAVDDQDRHLEHYSGRRRDLRNGVCLVRVGESHDDDRDDIHALVD